MFAPLDKHRSIERFHQTMKQHLEATPTRSLAQLQDRLDVFTAYYNDVRPHRARDRMTPRAAYDARTKARPSGSPIRDAGEFRIRHDRVDQTGKVTLRYAGKLRHLGIGRAHRGQHVLVLAHDRDVRVLTTDGELIAQHQIDPTRNYQPRR
ncbi:MAG: integrase core domain-containing protein [Gaiellaceae bacterium]